MQFVSEMIWHFLTKQYLFIVGDRNTCRALALIISDDSLIRSVSNGSVMDLSAFLPHLSFTDTSLTLRKQNPIITAVVIMWQGENQDAFTTQYRWLAIYLCCIVTNGLFWFLTILLNAQNTFVYV